MAMIPFLIARLRGASVYRRVVAVMVAGCVASFVLGQAAGHQPHRVAATVTNPARTAAIIAGSIGTPIVAPPHITVPLSASPVHQAHGNGGKHDGRHHGKDGGDSPDAWHATAPKDGLDGGDHHEGGAPTLSVPATEDN